MITLVCDCANRRLDRINADFFGWRAPVLAQILTSFTGIPYNFQCEK